jgi:hypothetical protein
MPISHKSTGAQDRSNAYFFLGSLQVWQAVRLDSIPHHSPAIRKDSIKKREKVTFAKGKQVVPRGGCLSLGEGSGEKECEARDIRTDR